MDYSPPGSSIRGIFQARLLEWVVISFSRASSWPRDQSCVSCIGRRVFTAEPPWKPITTCYWTEINRMKKKKKNTVHKIIIMTARATWLNTFWSFSRRTDSQKQRRCQHHLTHGIAVQQEHSMGTAILLHCHVVGVDTIGVLLVLRESWGEGQEVIRQRLKREIEEKKKLNKLINKVCLVFSVK